MTTDGAADVILVLAGLAAVFIGFMAAVGAMVAYCTRHVEDIPPSSQSADDFWSDDL